MAGSSLFVLFDDIALLLDEVAAMSKIAAKSTAGVLGDDLALNAEQVSGVHSDRELAVVWAVAKGSFLNKLILVPSALLISAFIPWLITPLLIIGGLYLCFEGAEKILHKLLHKDEVAKHHEELIEAIHDPSIDLMELEKDKIKGAIRTDFILSAEIIAITLGVVAGSTFGVQAAVLSTIALAVTLIVYGLVAGIVRLDDWGMVLNQTKGKNALSSIKRKLGYGILQFAPFLMKTLSIVGTAAMFLVGGGILVHGIPFLHHIAEGVIHAANSFGGFIAGASSVASNGVIGIIAGLIMVAIVTVGSKLISLFKAKS